MYRYLNSFLFDRNGWGKALKFIVVLMTTKDKEEASQILHHLLEKKLIACGNVVSNINSYYWWEGKIEESQESLVFMKTSPEKFREIKEVVKTLHSYTVPELIALPIKDGLQSYLDWLESSLTK